MHRKYFLPSLYILLAISLILGIVFRCIYLDHKVFWFDEACTLLRISGHAEVDFLQQFSFDSIVETDALQEYQKPNSGTGISGTIKGLATEEPQLSPLYFILLHGWMKYFGDSITIVRSLSVLFSLLLFPALYWFCQELFQAFLPTWIAIGLIAVSPLQLGFAQEARPYALWLLTFILSNAAFLRAVRLNSYSSWIIYAITIPLNIYTYILSGLSFLAHSVYIVWHERFRFSRLISNYLISLLAGMLCSAGWLLVIMFNFISIPQLKGIDGDNLNPLTAAKRVIGGIRTVFFDLNNDKNNPDFIFFGTSPNLILNLLILGLFIYCLYLLLQSSSRSTSLFIIILTIFISLPLILTGKYLPRYLITFYLMIQLIISYGLANRISAAIRQWRLSWWYIVIVFLLSLSTFACVVGLRKETSWIKHTFQEIQIARIINRSPKPLVISDSSSCAFLTLNHYLDSKVRLLIEPSCGICRSGAATFKRVERLPDIPKSFSQVFLYSPSQKLLDGLSKIHTVKLVQEASLGSTQLYTLID